MALIYDRFTKSYLTGALSVKHEVGYKQPVIELGEGDTGAQFRIISDGQISFDTPLSRAKDYPLDDAMEVILMWPEYEIHFPHGYTPMRSI